MIIDEKMIMKRCHNLTYDYRNVDVKKKKKEKSNRLPTSDIYSILAHLCFIQFSILSLYFNASL